MTSRVSHPRHTNVPPYPSSACRKKKNSPSQHIVTLRPIDPWFHVDPSTMSGTSDHEPTNRSSVLPSTHPIPFSFGADPPPPATMSTTATKSLFLLPYSRLFLF